MKKLTVFLIVISVLGIIFYGGFYFIGDETTYAPRYHHGSFIFHGGFMAIFWIIVIFLIYTGVESRTSSNDYNRAQAIIDERYAKGEIDETTYKNLTNTLKEKK